MCVHFYHLFPGKVQKNDKFYIVLLKDGLVTVPKQLKHDETFKNQVVSIDKHIIE